MDGSGDDSLRLDGHELTVRENGREMVSWPAVSGRPGLQGQQYQLWRDHGPLPRSWQASSSLALVWRLFSDRAYRNHLLISAAILAAAHLATVYLLLNPS
jgi:hypothetical protein